MRPRPGISTASCFGLRVDFVGTDKFRFRRVGCGCGDRLEKIYRSADREGVGCWEEEKLSFAKWVAVR